MKIDLVIPVHNEGKTIVKTVRRYMAYFSNTDIDISIIAVLNGCTDNTKEEIEKVRNKKLGIINMKEADKGLAIKKGFEQALKNSGDLVSFVDADMATAPKQFHNLIKRISKYDGVIGSRYLKESIVRPKQKLTRRILSRVFNLIVRALFFLPYRDTQCGAKVFRKKAIRRVLPDIETTGFVIDVDLLYHLKEHDFTIKEAPTKWSDKEGSSLSLLKNGYQIILELLKLRLRSLMKV